MLSAVRERGSVTDVVEPSGRHQLITVLGKLRPLLRRLRNETDVIPSVTAAIQQLASDSFAVTYPPLHKSTIGDSAA